MNDSTVVNVVVTKTTNALLIWCMCIMYQCTYFTVVESSIVYFESSIIRDWKTNVLSSVVSYISIVKQTGAFHVHNSQYAFPKSNVKQTRKMMNNKMYCLITGHIQGSLVHKVLDV